MAVYYIIRSTVPRTGLPDDFRYSGIGRDRVDDNPRSDKVCLHNDRLPRTFGATYEAWQRL
jgi:hypothetical protein